MGMRKSLSKTKHFNLFYLFFFINIYNIVVVFFFLTPPNLYPIKKCFQIGTPSFHPNTILFNIPEWTLPTTKICTAAQGTLWLKEWAESHWDHGSPPYILCFRRRPHKRWKPSQHTQWYPLGHKGRFLIHPEAIHFYLHLPEEMEKISLSPMTLIGTQAWSSVAYRLAGTLNGILAKK